MADTISFRYEDKDRISEFAKENDVSISEIYREFSDLILEDEMLEDYIMARIDGSAGSLADYAKNTLGLPEDINYSKDVSTRAVETITQGYILGDRELFLDGVEQLDDVAETDLAEYAAEQLDRAYDRLI
ncbi:MAG: hypothetical protein ABEJ99_02935 [Candidatus Nanohaloarchaea archaeon]